MSAARRVLVTRPLGQAEATAERLRAAGHTALIEPMLEIADVPVRLGSLDAYQAILFTSGNAVRAFARQCSATDLPVYAVGEATAETARTAGFERVRNAGGNAVDLAALARRALQPTAGRLLHPTGDKIATDIAALLGGEGFAVDRIEVYHGKPRTAFSPEVRGAIKSGEIDDVLLFSARTAATFAEVLWASGLSGRADAMRALCLSDAVAKAADAVPWAGVAVAAHSDQESLLALLDC